MGFPPIYCYDDHYSSCFSADHSTHTDCCLLQLHTFRCYCSIDSHYELLSHYSLNSALEDDFHGQVLLGYHLLEYFEVLANFS